MLKKLVGILVCASFLTACSSSDEQLSIGKYDNENNVVFSDVVTNEEDINQFKSIINEAESLGNQPNEIPNEEPVRVVMVNNHADSTMVMYVSIWEIDDNTVVISRGFNTNEDSYLLLNADSTKQLNEVIKIND
ncbi:MULTISPECIES: hypothetical protein [Shouchella]|uniref:Lipoprotein n=2 Tax=Shouchella TaxID=2893057 RepID=A0ABY7W3A0_9BACI|nr:MULTISPECIES: hypothetical protein [Shouchella]MED4129735.1 hypothetical protein [Shouchella miscanthi]WDF02069.1 hypothetical protein PQ477_11095 [Shouchella hunanensis]GAF22897.1 hypothetical protein JCM19047_2676 [Bacillus sp. JCM 19047]